MKKQQEQRPLFATIAQSGGTFGVTFHTDGKYTNMNVSGYSIETILTRAPKECQVIDFRPADAGKVLKVIMAVDGIQERDGYGIPAQEYIERMREAGANICTVEELKEQEYFLKLENN